MSLLDTGWELNTPTVISDVIDGETLLIHLRTGSYFVLPPSAAEVWRTLTSGVPGRSLLEGPGDPRAAALTGLVERAVTIGLLRQSAADTILLDRPAWEAGDLELEEHAQESATCSARTPLPGGHRMSGGTPSGRA